MKWIRVSLSLSLSLYSLRLTLSNSFELWLVKTLTLLIFCLYDLLNLALSYQLVLVCVGVGEILIVFKGNVYCDLWLWNFLIGSWLLWLRASCMRLVCWVGWGVDRHIGLGEIFELGEVNAHGMCASATNKQ